MATTRAQLRNSIRDVLHDWPVNRAPLAAQVTAAATDFTFASQAETELFKKGYCCEVESEVCMVTVVDGAGKHITVTRGYRGTTAAVHLASSVITSTDLFTDNELNRNISSAIRFSWPAIWLPRRVVHSSQTAAGTLEYELANTNLFELEMDDGSGRGTYRPMHNITLSQVMAAAGTPTPVESLHTIVTFHSQPPEGRNLRYFYADRVPDLTSDTAELWFESFEPAITEYLMWQAASLAAADLIGQRMRFHEYSVAVQDRVADVDAIIRSRFAYQNSAQVVLASIRRPLPPIWAQRRRV